MLEIPIVLALMVIELLAYIMVPEHLARLAFWPIGKPHRVAGATGDVQQSMPFFEERCVGAWYGRSGWVRLTLRVGGWNPTMGLARLRLHRDGGVTVISARALPTPLSILAVIPVFAFDTTQLTLDFEGAALACAIAGTAWIVGIVRLGREVDAVKERIAANIEQHSRATHGEGTDGPADTINGVE